MAQQMIVVTCGLCGARVKCSAPKMDRILAGAVKCPHCRMTLQPQRGTLGLQMDDESSGVTLATGKGATLRVKSNAGIAVAAFAVPAVRSTSEVRRLEEDLHALRTKHQFTRVVLNFSKLKFMSSSVISVLVRFKESLGKAGGDIVLCDVPLDIRKVLEVMHLHKLFEIHNTETGALKALRKQS